MSRKQRVLKKRYAIFCEGDTEYNYTDKMRKKQGVELVLKPINMHGGGYSNFLRQIKKESQTNYLAKFIIVDADRIVSVPGEKENFLKLLEYCKIQNDKGNTSLFVITDNPDLNMWHVFMMQITKARIRRATSSGHGDIRIWMLSKTIRRYMSFKYRKEVF